MLKVCRCKLSLTFNRMYLLLFLVAVVVVVAAAVAELLCFYFILYIVGMAVGGSNLKPDLSEV